MKHARLRLLGDVLPAVVLTAAAAVLLAPRLDRLDRPAQPRTRPVRRRPQP